MSNRFYFLFFLFSFPLSNRVNVVVREFINLFVLRSVLICRMFNWRKLVLVHRRRLKECSSEARNSNSEPLKSMTRTGKSWKQSQSWRHANNNWDLDLDWLIIYVECIDSRFLFVIWLYGIVLLVSFSFGRIEWSESIVKSSRSNCGPWKCTHPCVTSLSQWAMRWREWTSCKLKLRKPRNVWTEFRLAFHWVFHSYLLAGKVDASNEKQLKEERSVVAQLTQVRTWMQPMLRWNI